MATIVKNTKSTKIKDISSKSDTKTVSKNLMES